MGNLQTELKYSYNDVSIIPSILSNVCHRGECNPFVYDNMLPLFTAPMDTVVSRTNYKEFYGEGITPILPRTEDLEIRKKYAMNGDWAAFSLQEFNDIFCNEEKKVPNGNDKIRALIDVANGHMACLYEAVRNAKNIYGMNIEIMVGNIANPYTYRVAAESGVDYIRCGIGTGAGCFDDGTLITLSDGTKKPIEDVCVGDSVLTHKGKSKTVTSRTRFKTSGAKIKINNEITCTKDHKFFVIDKKNNGIVNEKNLEQYAYWVEASKLDKNKHLLIKRTISFE